jgi:nucleotide-binding universal stress UspA family protein
MSVTVNTPYGGATAVGRKDGLSRASTQASSRDAALTVVERGLLARDPDPAEVSVVTHYGQGTARRVDRTAARMRVGTSAIPQQKESVMTEEHSSGPVLFCFDGSEGSRGAMRAAADLIGRPVDAVVITVWETVATRLALSGAFVAGITTGGGDLDSEEEAFAKSVAEEGAQRAREHGYNASALTRESFDGISRAILDVADGLSARLIVCGQRGRGTLRTALLGSVSHTLAAHTRHPVLIAPEMPVDEDATRS